MSRPMQPELVPVVLVKNDEYWLPYALEATRGHFGRYVIYDIGSTDRTVDIIRWFMETNPDVEFVTKFLPHLNPSIQGIFRNSMIAEARSEYYFILDADEIYPTEHYPSLIDATRELRAYGEMNGVVARMELTGDLKQSYGLAHRTPHQRLYHRTAIFKGPHPGEEPFYPQDEFWPSFMLHCYHFHNCERSTKDAEVPKRLERRGRATYHRGETGDIDLLKVLPILREQIEDFPVCPALKELQDGQVQVR